MNSLHDLNFVLGDDVKWHHLFGAYSHAPIWEAQYALETLLLISLLGTPLPKKSTAISSWGPRLADLPVKDVSQNLCTVAASQTQPPRFRQHSSTSESLSDCILDALHPAFHETSEMRCHMHCFRARGLQWCHFKFRMTHRWCWQLT